MTALGGSFLDSRRVSVQPGSGVVARHPGLLLVMPAITDRAAAAADRLLEICEQAAGEAPGRRLARRVAGLLAETDPDDVPHVAVLADGLGGLVAILCGDIDLTVAGPRPLDLSGADAVSWVERVLPADVDELTVKATGASGPDPAAPARLDLQLGTVPGGGVTLRRRQAAALTSAPQPATPPLPEVDVPVTGRHQVAGPAGSAPTKGAPATPIGEPVAGPAGTETPLPEPAVAEPADTGEESADAEPGAASAGVGPGDVVLVALTGGPDPDEAPRDPLPLTVDEPKQPPSDGPVAVVRGIVCSRGHFNNPDAAYCSVCGISMVQRTHEYIAAPRPPLGVIVFDDGVTFTLTGDYVLGRSPAGDEAVLTGRARPLVVEDAEDTVSRVHAEIHLEQWLVYISDRGSANGTYLAIDGSSWESIPPETPTALPPGTRVRLGQRMFVFDAHQLRGAP
jgi:hypothetical protein